MFHIYLLKKIRITFIKNSKPTTFITSCCQYSKENYVYVTMFCCYISQIVEWPRCVSWIETCSYWRNSKSWPNMLFIDAKPKLYIESDSNGADIAPKIEHCYLVIFKKVDVKSAPSGYNSGKDLPEEVEQIFCRNVFFIKLPFIWCFCLFKHIPHQFNIMACSIPRRPLFLHALSLECNKKFCINFLNQFKFIFTFKYCTKQFSHWIVSCTKKIQFFNDLYNKFCCYWIIDFFKNTRFHFYCSIELSIFWLNELYSLNRKVSIKKIILDIHQN